MITRIIYAALALIALYLCLDTGRMVSARHTLRTTEEGYFSAPENADLTVVEFLDYGCPHCQKTHPILSEAMRRDGRIRYIPRPVSFLGPESKYKGALVYAAGKQGKFMEMHSKLISTFHALQGNDDLLRSMASELDLDFEQLKQDAQDEKTTAPLAKNLRILGALTAKATPTYLIGDRMIYAPTAAGPTTDDFLNMFNEARGQR